MTLQDIADRANARLQTASNPSASRDILLLFSDLVAVLQAKAGPDPRDAQILELLNRVTSLQSLLDNDAVTFDAIKISLGNPNLTQGELATEIATKWKRK